MVRKVLALVLAGAAAALIGWRVLGPAEVSHTATTAAPVARLLPAGVTGKTTMAALIVAGQVRVYAGERLVKADAPVEAKTMYTPRWSYRRWPARVSGVVASGTTVVSRWTDGLLVALDARTGEVLWKADGPAADGFTGRTGSDAVYAPPGLYVSGTTVMVAAEGRLIARSVADGTQVWTVAADCPAGSVDDSGHLVCGPLGYDVATGQRRPPTPAQLQLTATSDAVTARGSAAWRWPGQAVVLGVRGQRVVLLAGQTLVELDARTGVQLRAFPLYTDNERVEPWRPYRWQLTDTWLALERRRPGTKADDYYTTDPVIIAAL
ncbi:PQQ-binding-like beta-propeller repeat protein [Actinoplanes sp. N902-109]|uniref:outer membrane protein assembly factor BamB family protein n=1 Tax=Actinoplanes sp. (strain N902-109) TaxID=649831 RepID=UPI0003293918|nr:PQQ-binding-like beta-propeller repeat protein [Actinoplanes sp. N902-109]AGL21338.1 pyrrolo-quinoline quinone [Actinoplanes sp. N902-109]